MTKTYEHTIKELLAPLLTERKLFLVELNIRGKKQKVVTIYVDAEDRDVNVDECTDVSRELGFLIDAHELLDDSYRLDVSSPGLSRPLVDYRQYPKNKGRRAKVKYKEQGNYHKLEGTIEEVDNDNVLLKTADGAELQIAFSDVVETKIIPDI